MSRISTTVLPVEQFVPASKKITGKSDLINSQMLPALEVRGEPRIILPRKDLGLTGRRLKFAELTKAIHDNGFLPAHLSELLLHSHDWDGYTSTWALGQVGEQRRNGQKFQFVPKLWGNGGFHDLGFSSLDGSWTDIDSLLVVPK